MSKPSPVSADAGREVTAVFVPRQNRTMAAAAFSTLGLIYHVTVHNLRKKSRSPVLSILSDVIRMILVILAFLGMYYLLGIKSSPLRGDFMLFIMTGIFLFFTHVEAVGSVARAGSSTAAMMKHEPMNTAVVITAAALGALYRQTLTCFIVLGLYYLHTPFTIENPVATVGMLLLAWFSGSAVGLVVLSIRPWSPMTAIVLTQGYTRLNMIASGKMFLANATPAHILVFFDWNPLFHIIDQSRGYAFINYTPHNSSLMYPIWVSIALLMLGLMGEFVTRQVESISWSAGR